ncbi:two component transcriptional regulator, LuxR family [Thiothrix caldifontis]|jgi:Response regulator containing a CheY-like receiver domain and an HTH DNA-binding domain|uniref:Two component transcriptional regulator, LuxR family n=1 Tax=Thiothrix caldifontis TaxID=525918 RepID=A0A1H4DPN2_9GAMM|nr:response regulator [Thiothrix caldifontis]SEA74469.1 two component transcriptional regulator, LuxR family [Thiothrix caldifontis]
MNEKVLLIDDHTLFRAGLEDLLTRRGIRVVAAVGSGDEGLAAALSLEPDIVLLDMRMPQMDGLSVLRQLRKNTPNLRVVMLTTSSNENDLVEALRSGARGYLLKDIEPDELVVALREIVAGKTVVAPELAPVLARVVQGGDARANEDKIANPFSELTPREYEILTLLAEGQSNKVIARNLGISDGTVKLHVKAILRKLNVSSRITAAVMAVEHGIRVEAANAEN